MLTSLADRRVFVTGGSGTLGRALLTIARQQHSNAHWTIYSRSESAQAAFKSRFPEVTTILGDVRDAARLEAAMAGHDVVIHAAAMKRIPECEAQPYECWQTNVIGTQNVVDAAERLGISNAIAISTDKACRAITMYGASKLAMETVVKQAARGRVPWVMVRYGNVVASRGSVIPQWRAQASRGEPLTVTDPQMTRFWMSPLLAARCVVRALGLAAGQTLVPKLGSLTIGALANLIAPKADILTIGKRSLEKSHEELINTDEPAAMCGDAFVLDASLPGRFFYDSCGTFRLSGEQFAAMLHEAEELEK